MKRFFTTICILMLVRPVVAQETEKKDDTAAATKKLLEALSRLKVSGYLQAQYVKDESSVDSLSSPSATRNRDQFSVRRARIKFAYQVSRTSRFVVQPDIASGGVSLKEGFIEFTEPWTAWHHTLTAGQFAWPFGFEVMYSSSDREMPEHSRVIRTLFPGEYDRGVQVSGVSDRFNYRIGVVNGTGTSQPFDFNKRKDVVGRIGGSLGKVTAGASIYRGAELVAVAGANAGREFAKRREGIDFQLVTPVPGLAFRGEYIRGVQPPSPGAAANQAVAADVSGYYLYAIQTVGKRSQFVLRYDSYDPDADNKLADVIANARVATLGGAYIFNWDANSKVMLSFEKLSTSGFTDPDDNVLTLRYQFKF